VKVRVLAEAEAEIDAARQYLNAESPNLGSRFVDEVEHALESIAARPLSFGSMETLPSGQPFRRALLPSFPYAVVFELISDIPTVIAVAHCSREPNYWLGRS